MFWLLSDKGEVRGKLATVGRGAICSCRSICRIGNRRSLGCICRLCFFDLNAPLRIGCAIVELCFVGCTPAFGCLKTSQSQRIGLNCSRIVEVVALRHVVANHRPVADIRPAPFLRSKCPLSSPKSGAGRGLLCPEKLPIQHSGIHFLSE